VVDLYLRTHAVPGLDPEDLYQEARLAWWLAEPIYDPSRGASRSTFISRVVENKLRDLLERAHARRRWQPGGPLSLDVPATEAGEDLADLLPDDSPSPEDSALTSDLRRQLEDVRRSLGRRRQRVMDALAEDPDRSRADLARSLGVSRDTLYADIAVIRAACRDAGLRDLLA
jgi:RNA polymerase sigma factor (sigma-70 family)